MIRLEPHVAANGDSAVALEVFFPTPYGLDAYGLESNCEALLFSYDGRFVHSAFNFSPPSLSKNYDITQSYLTKV